MKVFLAEQLLKMYLRNVIKLWSCWYLVWSVVEE